MVVGAHSNDMIIISKDELGKNWPSVSCRHSLIKGGGEGNVFCALKSVN